MDLYEVSIVTIPAYDDTDVQLVRSKKNDDKLVGVVEMRKKMIKQIKGELEHE